MAWISGGSGRLPSVPSVRNHPSEFRQIPWMVSNRSGLPVERLLTRVERNTQPTCRQVEDSARNQETAWSAPSNPRLVLKRIWTAPRDTPRLLVWRGACAFIPSSVAASPPVHLTWCFGRSRIGAGLGFNRAVGKTKVASSDSHGKRQVNEVTFHGLRHTFTTWLKATGASNALAQMIVGHDSPLVSSRYTHLSTEDTAESINKLPDVTTAR